MYIGIYLENAAHKALLLASYLFSEYTFFQCHVQEYQNWESKFCYLISFLKQFITYLKVQPEFKIFVVKSLLTTPSNVLPLQLKQTFLP